MINEISLGWPIWTNGLQVLSLKGLMKREEISNCCCTCLKKRSPLVKNLSIWVKAGDALSYLLLVFTMACHYPILLVVCIVWSFSSAQRMDFQDEGKEKWESYLGVDYTVRYGWRFHVRQTVCCRGWPTNVACLGVKRFVGHRNAHRKRYV
jgi:hypothetical protein